MRKWTASKIDRRAQSGYYVRDIILDNRPQRHIGLHVVGTYDAGLSLGMVAVRCERKGATVIPLTLSIPEDTIMRE